MPAQSRNSLGRYGNGGRYLALVFVACALNFAAHAAAAETGFLDRVHTDADGEHKYVVFVPKDYAEDRDWPVILFLHGAGERGSDGLLQTQVGLGPAILAREDFPFIAVFPQVEDLEGPARQAWFPEAPDGRRALAILDEVRRNYRTDDDRLYLTGLSMGGFGVWAQAAADPGRWAAVVPLCGGGDTAWAEKLAPLPIWCFHGGQDRAVPAQLSREMIDALRAAGGNPIYTEYPELEHNCWDAAYGDDALYDWLLAQRRGQAPSHAPPPGGSSARRLPDDAPFTPALDIPAAAFVQLDNRILAVLGDALPRMAPPDALAGRMANTETTSQSQVGPMRVRFSELRYAGRLGRATLAARADGSLAVTLRARNVRLTIGRTTVAGGGRSAECGPMTIELGHRYDLAIRCAVRPVVEDRRLRLKLLDARFKIPRDNWRVGSPAWVNARGLFMTRDRMTSSLREGFYSQPEKFEEQVIAALPAVLERLEKELRFDAVDDLVVGMWPLPVYKPRVRTWPSAVRVDDRGATLELGISVAALTEAQAAAGTRQIDLATMNEPAISEGGGLRFGLAPDVMGPISSLMVEAGVARVLVVDAPMRGLLPLADTAALAEMFPGLTASGATEVRSELILRQGIRMAPNDNDADEIGGANGELELALPGVFCAIAARRSAEEEFAPFAEIDFGIRQRALPVLQRPTPGTRALSLVWNDAAELEVAARRVADAPPDESSVAPPIDVERIRGVISAGWKEWTETGPLSAARLADLELGSDRLRAQAIGWNGRYLTADFQPAGLTVRNATDAAVEYETRGPHSGWGGPYALPPGEEHRYAIAHPLTCRFASGGRQKAYTLGSGLRLEFRRTAGGELELYALPDRTAP